MLILLSVWVNHSSTLELRTMVGADLGAKACAEAGSNCNGMSTAATRVCVGKVPDFDRMIDEVSGYDRLEPEAL